jgi:hypothetical protein
MVGLIIDIEIYARIYSSWFSILAAQADSVIDSNQWG